MSTTATLDPPIDESVLDELVPPPGPRWRRAALWTGFLTLAVAAMWAMTSGTVVPQVSTNVQSWGGSGPVGIAASVTNESRVPIEIVGGPHDRAGLTSIGTTTEPPGMLDNPPEGRPTDPFPLRLEPGESIDLTFWYQVHDCDAVARTPDSDQDIDLQVRIADGPVSGITSTRSVDASDLSFDRDQPLPWPRAITEHACPS